MLTKILLAEEIAQVKEAIPWARCASGNVWLTLWDITSLPSLILAGGVTPDCCVVVRIPAEVVFAHVFELVLVGFLYSPVLAIFSRHCFVNLTLVVFSITSLTI